MTRVSVLGFAAIAVVACGVGEVDVGENTSGAAGERSSEVTVALPGEGTPGAVGALLVANDCTIGFEELDLAAGLYASAAQAIVASRAGSDGACGTADDRRFAALSELLAIPRVGPASVARLVLHAQALGLVPSYGGGAVEGVTFSDAEAHRALVVANTASAEQLDRQAGLRADAARNVVAARPLASLASLAAVPRVGSASLAQLRAFAGVDPVAPEVEPEPTPEETPAPTQPEGYVLGAEFAAMITVRAKEGLWEDENFSREVADLASWDEAVFGRIMRALEAEVDRLVAPLVGATFASEDAAHDAILEQASSVKRAVRAEGWTYLEQLGVAR